MKFKKNNLRKNLIYIALISMVSLSSIVYPRDVYADSFSNRNINEVYSYGQRGDSSDASRDDAGSTTQPDKKTGVSDFNFDGTNSMNLTNNEANIPSKYDPREKGYMTDVRDQEDLGICWTFAGEAALESYLKKNGYGEFDLSEEHMRWWGKNGTYNWNIGDEEGATNEASIGYFTSWMGPKFEKDIPYNGKQTIEKGAKRPDNYDSAPKIDYQVLDVVNVGQNQAAVKEAIMKYGAVTSGYYDNPDYVTSDGNSFYCDKPLGQNHAIIIVGWDDNYSRNNFRADNRPENDGAWLVKNSWGKYNSEQGYLWISYNDKTILSFTDNYAIARVQQNKGQKIYQHEYSMSSTLKDSVLVAANRFDFGRGEGLDGVMFATDSVGANYEIYYIPEIKGKLDYNSRIFVSSGVVKHSGYTTAEVDHFPLATGKGAIAVKIDNSKNRKKASIGLEKNVKNFKMFVAKASPGESYVFRNGRLFDLNVDAKFGPVNVVIKAITTPYEGGNVIAGNNRFDTALKVAEQGFEKTDNVILVNGSAISDALTSTPLAKLKDAPILLINRDSVSKEVLDKMKSMGVKNVTIIGGDNSISASVESGLKSDGYSVNRIAGDNRYQTSYKIAGELFKDKKDISSIAIVNGRKGLADAISFSSVAGYNSIPILLSDNSGVLKEIDDILKDKNINDTYIIGGFSSIPKEAESSYKSVTRLSGINRNDTNAKIIEKFYPNNELKEVFIVKDGKEDVQTLIDGLAVGAYASKTNSPIVLVNSRLVRSQLNSLRNKKIEKITQVGGGLNSMGATQLLMLNRNK